MQKEREAYEVIVDDGRLVYKKSGLFVDTVEGSKWIFVLSTSRALYVGQVDIKLMVLCYNRILVSLFCILCCSLCQPYLLLLSIICAEEER